VGPSSSHIKGKWGKFELRICVYFKKVIEHLLLTEREKKGRGRSHDGGDPQKRGQKQRSSLPCRESKCQKKCESPLGGIMIETSPKECENHRHQVRPGGGSVDFHKNKHYKTSVRTHATVEGKKILLRGRKKSPTNAKRGVPPVSRGGRKRDRRTFFSDTGGVKQAPLTDLIQVQNTTQHRKKSLGLWDWERVRGETCV